MADYLNIVTSVYANKLLFIVTQLPPITLYVIFVYS